MSKQIGMFKPKSEWLPPMDFPDIKDAKRIAIDLETKDPNITEKGAGWATNDGHIIGVAIAVDGWEGYYPVRHETGFNHSPEIVFDWLNEMLSTDCEKIAHNASYDFGWLQAEGVKWNGRIIDTMIAGPLIDENRFSYSLNAMSKEYLGESKNEFLLKETAAQWGVDAKAEMYKIPAQFVGEYAEQDAVLCLKLWDRLSVEVTKNNLETVFNLETDLLPVLMEMRKKGVRVNLDKLGVAEKELIKRENKLLNFVHDKTGGKVDIWAARSIASIFDLCKIDYPKTDKGNPSFTKSFLENHPHPVPKAIVQAREYNKARTTFLHTIERYNHNGRIHANINQLRTENGGAVTGRFSYSNPNLQQIPARDSKEADIKIGTMIRSLFLPEEGEKWGSFDYSQQEPRLVVHYADFIGLAGSEKLVGAYREDKNTDFHTIMAEIGKIERKSAKTINLGLFYGMGVGKLADQLGINPEEAKLLITEYNERVPFVRKLADRVSDHAGKTGKVKTFLGRQCHFDLWEPKAFGAHRAYPYEKAKEEHGINTPLKRAGTYKALNRLIQGSAADQTKQAMVTLYKEGVIPMIQIHDELAISVDGSKEQQEKIIEVMENAIELNIPSKVDVAVGDNWGEAQ
jgi:DNA polymerase I-like protein with 3'-5' exonuclease and polymerase domains